MNETVDAIAALLPELLKLGGWGALIALFMTRRIVTKGEKDEAIAVERERVADKEGQIAVLAAAVKDGDAAMERLAVAWEAAIALITRQREGRAS
jgi:hypothetical protein